MQERLLKKLGKYGEKWSKETTFKTKRYLIEKSNELFGENSNRIIKKIVDSVSAMEGLAISMDKSEKFIQLFIVEDVADKLSSQWQLIIFEHRNSK